MCIRDRERIPVSEVQHYFFTQININTIHQTLDSLGVERSKAKTIMHEFGYTGSAAIPMAFDAAWSNDEIKNGEYVIFMGSGGGLAFACALFKM